MNIGHQYNSIPAGPRFTPVSHQCGCQSISAFPNQGWNAGIEMPAFSSSFSTQAMMMMLLNQMMMMSSGQGYGPMTQMPSSSQHMGLPSAGWTYPGQGSIFSGRNQGNHSAFPVGASSLPQPAPRRQTVAPSQAAVRRNATAEEMTAALKGEDRQAFLKLNHRNRQLFGNVLAKSQKNGKLTKGMQNLLRSGRLEAKDRSGRTVVSHLNRLANSKLQKGVGRSEALNHLANSLANYRTFNQDGQGSCTATSIGREHIRKMPGDFARVTTDLLTKGSSVGVGGYRVRYDSGDMSVSDGTGRNQVERAYQDAMMNFGHNGKYDPKKNEGLPTERTIKLSNNVLGTNFSYRRRTANRWSFNRALNKAASRNERLYAGLHWGDGGHAVSVVGKKDGYIYFDNPWGYDEDGQNGPKRIPVGKGGLAKMKESDFYRHLRAHAVYK